MQGILPCDIFTPDSIIKKMVEKTDIINKIIVDPACGNGNILIYLIKKLQSKNIPDNKIIDSLYGYEINENYLNICKQRIKELLPSVSDIEINKHIQLKNGLSINKDFDIVIMNPPYSRDTHKNFLLWAYQHSSEIISIQPNQFMYIHDKIRSIDVQIQTLLNRKCKEIDIYNPNKIWTDKEFMSPVGIFYLNNNHQDYIKINDYMTNDFYTVKTVDEIIKNKTKIEPFYQKLLQFLKNKKILKNYITNKPEKEWYVPLAGVMGHISQTDDDLFSQNDFTILITRNAKPYQSPNDIKPYKYFNFDTEQECWNFINYLKTDFVRTCVYIGKYNLHIDNHAILYIPYLDFTKNYTDNELFDMIGIENPKIIPKYY